MSDKVFTEGIIYKDPRQGAPDYVKGSISFKTEEAIAWLQRHNKNGWVNINLMISKGGKPYAELDQWEPKKREDGDYSPKTDTRHNGFEDDIPF